jgi:hypothetical protein
MLGGPVGRCQSGIHFPKRVIFCIGLGCTQLDSILHSEIALRCPSPGQGQLEAQEDPQEPKDATASGGVGGPSSSNTTVKSACLQGGHRCPFVHFLALQARLVVPWSGSGCGNERAARYLPATGSPHAPLAPWVRIQGGAAGTRARRYDGNGPPPGVPGSPGTLS